MYQFITKNIAKDTNERPDEEPPRARSGRVPNTGASVSVGLGCTAPPTLCAHARLPSCLGSFVAPSLNRHDGFS